MQQWNALFDRELPEPLASIAEWLSTGEKLVHSGLELDGKSNVDAMKYMERTVAFHHVSLMMAAIETSSISATLQDLPASTRALLSDSSNQQSSGSRCPSRTDQDAAKTHRSSFHGIQYPNAESFTSPGPLQDSCVRRGFGAEIEDVESRSFVIPAEKME